MLRVTKSSLAIAAAISTATYAAKVTTIGQFAPGTWFENLAPTANGHILVTEILHPRLWSFDPLAPGEPPVLVHEYPQYESLLGITEADDPDVFTISAGNISFSNGAIVIEPASFDLWEVDYRVAPAPTRKIAHFGEAGLLNGLTYLPSANAILGADSVNGLLWLTDLTTGEVRVAANDTLMRPCPGPLVLGINGVRYREADSTLYFTNSNCQTINKIVLNTDGTAAGPAQTIAKLTADDFDIAKDGTLYVTDVYQNRIVSFNIDGSNMQVVAGSLNSSEIAEPTSVRVATCEKSHGKHTLYVSTAGGFAAPVNGTTIVGAQVVKIDQVQPSKPLPNRSVLHSVFSFLHYYLVSR